jgi:hypothetical protein
MSERSESKRIDAKKHKNSGRNTHKGDATWRLASLLQSTRKYGLRLLLTLFVMGMTLSLLSYWVIQELRLASLLLSSAC